MSGDRKAKAKTLPITTGVKKSAKIVLAFLIIVSLLSPIPYFLSLFTFFYLPVILVADGVFLYCGYKLVKNPNKKTAAEVQKLLKLSMLIALVAFIAGADKLHTLILQYLR